MMGFCCKCLNQYDSKDLSEAKGKLNGLCVSCWDKVVDSAGSPYTLEPRKRNKEKEKEAESQKRRRAESKAERRKGVRGVTSTVGTH